MNIAIGQEAVASNPQTKTRKTSAPIEIPSPSASASASVAQKMEKSSKEAHRSPTTPPSTPQEIDSLRFPPPIQFDLGDDQLESKVDEGLRMEETFEIRFLGCVQVPTDRGERLCQDVCRQVLDTRRAHNFGQSPTFRMAMSETEILIFDGEKKRQVRRRFNLADVAFWTSVGDESPKTWALIVREDRPLFRCYVFEAAELKGSEICDALKIATQLAFETALIRQTEAQVGAVQLMEMMNEGQKTETSNVIQPKASNVDQTEASIVIPTEAPNVNKPETSNVIPTETSNVNQPEASNVKQPETSNVNQTDAKEDLPVETETATDAH